MDNEIPTTYATLANDVSPGDRVLLDDGLMELGVESISTLAGLTISVNGRPIISPSLYSTR